MSRPGRTRRSPSSAATMRKPPASPADAFKPLIGQLVWSVERGVEPALLMNFGRPHLVVAEPHTARPEASRGIARFFKRRRMRFDGHWSVLADSGAWKITTASFYLTSRM